jgi:hypothetical protein
MQSIPNIGALQNVIKLINISPFRKKHDLKQFVFVFSLKVVIVLYSRLN